MSVIATVAVEAGDFALGETLAADPEMEVRLESMVPTGDALIPYFWVSDDSVDDIQRALRAEDDVESLTVVDRVDGEALVRVEWNRAINGLIRTMVETGATLLEANGTTEQWTLQLRFADHDGLSAFYRECAEQGISLDLVSVHNPGLPDDVGLGFDLTDTQRETLGLALERGYFEVPRRINLTDLAAEVGVSDTAVSQRIRRGLSKLLVQTLPESEAEPKTETETDSAADR